MTYHINNKSMLNTICPEVPKGENLNRLFDRMFTYVGKHGGIQGGIGLAANQIGSDERAFVMDCNGFKGVFINPVITKMHGGTVGSKESCLSFPGKTIMVIRYKRIIIEAYDQNWVRFAYKFQGLNAACVQHEVDHLNGITILNRAKLGVVKCDN